MAAISVNRDGAGDIITFDTVAEVGSAAEFISSIKEVWGEGVLLKPSSTSTFTARTPEPFPHGIYTFRQKSVRQEPHWQQQTCDEDLTGQYVRHLLEPALCSVPTAAEIPALFQSALRISGTLPFPVPDVFHESQRRQDGDMKHYLAPVSQSAAVKFSSKLHDVLTKSFPAGTEMVQAGHFDQLVCEMRELLDQYASRLNLKRKRNEGEASLTLTAKRPDLCLLVRDALLFKGEDQTDESNLNQAVAELKQKMRRWSQSYHGKVEFLLCYAMAGGHVRICMLRRDDADSCQV